MSLLVALVASSAVGQFRPKQHIRRELNVWVDQNITTSSKVRLRFNSRNVPVVEVTASKVDPVKWFTRTFDSQIPTAIGRPVKSWRLSLASPGQRLAARGDNYLSREVSLPPLPPGVYRIEADGDGKVATAVVNVTNMAVVVKRSPYHVLAWVTDVATGKVSPGARVGLYKTGGGVIAQATTNREGVAIFGAKPGSGPVIVQRSRDVAGFRTSAEDPDGRLRALFQTDRPIYRPGQTVHFKAVLRRTHDQGYDPVLGAAVTVELRDPRDNPLDRTRLEPSKYGSVSGEFQLPEEGMIGPYTLQLSVGGQRAYQTFTVAEYRKPEYKVTIGSDATRYLAGQNVHFKLDSRFYFGAPVPQAQVFWQVRRAPMSMFAEGEADAWFYGGGGNLYPRDTYASEPFVAEDRTVTDNDGKATITVKTDPNQPDSTYTLTATVTDNARRTVQASSSATVYQALIRIGIESDLEYASLGGLIPVHLRLVDLDGKPVGAKVALRVLQEVWDEKTNRSHLNVLTTTNLTVPRTGVAKMNLPALAEGDLLIEASAKDPTGRTTKTTMSMYVVGAFVASKKTREAPTIAIRTDKRVYKPGDTVKAYVSTNAPRHPILVVGEGRDIWAYKVFQEGKAGQGWNLPATEKLSPNAYLSATEWVKSQMLDAVVTVPVPDPRRRLDVQVQPDKSIYKPGEQASFTVRTTNGVKGVPAEVALSVVDEAIYAVSPDTTPDPYGFYWGLRANQVSTFESSPQELSAGAYQRTNSATPVRQRFEDTAFWNGLVDTDENGIGRVSFQMPDNLTSWRATARAVDGATAVGRGLIEVVATRPLTMRLATPRQFVQGDRLVLIGTLNCRLKRELSCRATLVVTGLRVEDEATKTVTVDAKSGQATVEWTLDASEVPASGLATLQAEVRPVDATNESPDVSDALKVSVPVLPRGVLRSQLLGGAMATSTEATLTLPADKLEPATKVSIEVQSGVAPIQKDAARAVLEGERYGSVAAANQLEAAVATGLGGRDKSVREAIALLGRDETGPGWGWWDGAPADPAITAKVAEALAQAAKAGYPVYSEMAARATGGCDQFYRQSQLWEHKALLAAALTMAGSKDGKPWITEVVKRGVNVSPFARLKMAEALALRDDAKGAEAIFAEAAQDASIEATDAYFPTGDGIGWTADEIETTAEGLTALMTIGAQPDLQTKLVRWLVQTGQSQWLSSDDDTAIARALGLYLKVHPDPVSLGDVTIELNGAPLKVEHSNVQSEVIARAPVGAALAGDNHIRITRSEDGEAFYTIKASYYQPDLRESAHGVRAVRRFEVRDSAGVWREVNRVARPGEPVRCTVVVWGDDLSDALIVKEPIPSGFEYVDSEWMQGAREEVRDGAVVHYLVNSGTPSTFRYYLRAESDGTLTALPVHAEYLRRPATSGQSAGETIEVKGS